MKSKLQLTAYLVSYDITHSLITLKVRKHKKIIFINLSDVTRIVINIVL